jgi:hypothetical protein
VDTFKDDVTVFLLLGVSFMVATPTDRKEHRKELNEVQDSIAATIPAWQI